MAATLDQLIRITGGAQIVFKGQKWFSKDAVNITIRTERFDAPNQYGAPTPLLRQAIAEISFTPYGHATQAMIDTLFKFQKWDSADTVVSTSWGAAAPGDVVAPKQGTGTELLGDIVIIPLRSGQNQYTFYRGECLRPPDITFTMTNTMIGRVTLTALGKMPDVALAGTAASNHLFTATGTYTQPPASEWLYTPRVCRPTVAWGAVVAASYVEQGAVFSVEPQLADLPVDGFAVPLRLVTGVRATVRCRIGNITDAVLQTIINAHNGITASSNLILGSPMNLAALLNDLTVVDDSTTFKVVLKNARLFAVTPVWDIQASRSGELVFENVRTISGTPAALTNVFENGSAAAGILWPAAAPSF